MHSYMIEGTEPEKINYRETQAMEKLPWLKELLEEKFSAWSTFIEEADVPPEVKNDFKSVLNEVKKKIREEAVQFAIEHLTQAQDNQVFFARRIEQMLWGVKVSMESLCKKFDPAIAAYFKERGEQARCGSVIATQLNTQAEAVVTLYDLLQEDMRKFGQNILTE